MSKAAPHSRLVTLAAIALTTVACRQDMFDQPKYRPLRPSAFYADGRSARPVPPNTVQYNEPDQSETIRQGTTNGVFAASIPIPVDEYLLRRGQQRFDIYCSPCHGRIGDGHGMVAKRGFIQPADLNGGRIRKAPPGYIYAVIENGYGSMPDYAEQTSVRDRWAIVAYIRALEFARAAPIAQLPPGDAEKLGTAR